MKSRVSSSSTYRWPSKYSIMISPRLWRPICSCNGRLWQVPKLSPAKLRKFFYGHNCRQEKKILERLALIKEAKPLTTDQAIIRPTALRVKLLAQQLKSLLPFIAEYEKRIAELFGSHPDRFLFDNLPGAGPALAPRLLTAFGTDRDRFEVVGDLLNLSGIAPIPHRQRQALQRPLPMGLPKAPATVFSRVRYSLDPFLPLGSNLLSSPNRQRQESPRGRTRAGL